MAIAPARPSPLAAIFKVNKPLIGNVHCAPLPGTPRYRGEPMSAIVKRAVEDARAYAAGGMNGLMLENHGDIPFLPPGEIGPEIVAAMSVLVKAVAEAVDLPYGINLLANSAIGALAIAKATDARFIRVNQWVNAYVANEGLVEGESGRALRFRRMIGADDVAIFADVHVKHGAHAIVGDRGVAELARDTEFYDADVAIATGNRTGDTVPPEEIAAVRAGTRLPVIAGSGIAKDNAAALMAELDGAIVGSSLKHDGVWWNQVDPARVEAFVTEVRRHHPA
ncbi:BtpA/SgcQ family protein [Geminicoccus flavidas]|uniref:BtpA/SgcQ family protein n=1 Tax=Geminicoccus flavidas TaxID=2506407 RepID=UPI00190FAC30|nr:BtpA/SgcQ family protein [Geminicoccus flavidas]